MKVFRVICNIPCPLPCCRLRVQSPSSPPSSSSLVRRSTLHCRIRTINALLRFARRGHVIKTSVTLALYRCAEMCLYVCVWLHFAAKERNLLRVISFRRCKRRDASEIPRSIFDILTFLFIDRCITVETDNELIKRKMHSSSRKSNHCRSL